MFVAAQRSLAEYHMFPTKGNLGAGGAMGGNRVEDANCPLSNGFGQITFPEVVEDGFSFTKGTDGLSSVDIAINLEMFEC